MIEYDVKTLWSEQAVVNFLNSIPLIFTTSYSGPHPELCRAALDGALHYLMGYVEKDFRTKSTGYPDTNGKTWVPLSQRRIKQRLAKTREVYLKKLGSKLFKLREARGDIGYEEGGQLPILIDEGNLVRAMSQGVISGVGLETHYSPTEGQEVSMVSPNMIEMDTTVSGAHSHQWGTPDNHPPQRKIVPDQMQDTWLEEATAVASQIICEFIVEVLNGPEII